MSVQQNDWVIGLPVWLMIGSLGADAILRISFQHFFWGFKGFFLLMPLKTLNPKRLSKMYYEKLYVIQEATIRGF